MICRLGKKVVTDLTIPFAKSNFPGLVSNIASNAASNAINKFEKRISGKGAVRVGKGFTLLISNEDIDDIFKTIKSLEDSNVLINGVTEAVKHEIKKQEGGFLTSLLAPLVASVIQPVENLFSGKDITGRGLTRAGKGYYNNTDKSF